MKINGEYPKFYMRVEGKRFAAIDNSSTLCITEDSNVECAFLWHNQSLCDSDLACVNLACEKNSVVYVEVPEKEK